MNSSNKFGTFSISQMYVCMCACYAFILEQWSSFQIIPENKNINQTHRANEERTTQIKHTHHCWAPLNISPGPLTDFAFKLCVLQLFVCACKICQKSELSGSCSSRTHVCQLAGHSMSAVSDRGQITPCCVSCVEFEF